MKQLLREYLPMTVENSVVESVEDKTSSTGKSLYMKGIFIQGDVRNANKRVYPVKEITEAVNSINNQLKENYTILGELDHPADLKINLDRVSHMITEMWVDGANGFGKMKILPTPMGLMVKTMLENGVKLGVSSRGSGDVNESTGHVSNFEVVTVDIVAQPSAPSAYPHAVYESLMNMKNGHRSFDVAKEASVDSKVQKYLKEEVIKLIKELKLK